jgi:hypothetical protein
MNVMAVAMITVMRNTVMNTGTAAAIGVLLRDGAWPVKTEGVMNL